MDNKMEQAVGIREEELTMDRTPFEKGAEKSVYRGIYQGLPVVVKIYRDHDIEGNPVNQAAAARQEFQSYKLLLNTPLSKYTPKSYGLFTDKQGHINGLIIEPKKGDVLGAIAKKIVAKEIFDQLEIDVLNCQGIVPSGDTLTDANIGFDGENLWFAEIITDTAVDRGQYERRIAREINLLRKVYQIKE